MYDKSKTLAIDRQHIWHPYTQMKDYEHRDPVVMVRGEGVRLYDADGTLYYDTVSSWWCNVHGHGHPALQQAIAQQAGQLDHVLFAGITHPLAAEVVDRLKSFLDPALSRFFFSDNGATSTEIAIKMAFQYWQNLGKKSKTRFVFLADAYHGDTVGAISVGGIELYHRLYAPLRFASHQVTAPACRTCPHRQSPFTWDARSTGCSLQCFAAMETLLRQESQHVAAVIVEPLMQGSAGISFYPPAYLQRLAALARELNVLLIFDEVATGFGRTGTLFAYQQAGTVPDILCLAKGLSGGTLPLALTVTREEIYQAFYSDDAASKTFFHGHTYTANPIACAAAAANLRLFKELDLPASRIPIAEHFHRRLREWEDLDCVADIRALGFIGAVDIVQSRKAQRTFAESQRIGFQIYLESLRHHLLLRPLGNTIYWFLPLMIEPQDVDVIMDQSRLAVTLAVTQAMKG